MLVHSEKLLQVFRHSIFGLAQDLVEVENIPLQILHFALYFLERARNCELLTREGLHYFGQSLLDDALSELEDHEENLLLPGIWQVETLLLIIGLEVDHLDKRVSSGHSEYQLSHSFRVCARDESAEV